eukprot:10177703-Ditylum_brightwellii.AAC.1
MSLISLISAFSVSDMYERGKGGVFICMTVSCNTVSFATSSSNLSSSVTFFVGVTKLEGGVDEMDGVRDLEPVIIIIIIIIKS